MKNDRPPACKIEIFVTINCEFSLSRLNETHPAVVRCQVTCLNHSVFYSPAMALIITSGEGRFEFIRAGNISSRDGLYEIIFNNISKCEAQNNYTMEFEYLIHSNNSNIDRAVLQCGVRIFSFTNPLISLCWGQSHGIIRYDTTDTATMTTASSPVTPTATKLPDIAKTLAYTSSSPTTRTDLSSSPTIMTDMLSQERSGLVSSIIVLAVINVTQAVLLFVLCMYTMRRLKKVVPEPVFVITKHPSEVSITSSSTHAELNQNLPDSGNKFTICMP